jgi:hypothetical protein
MTWWSRWSAVEMIGLHGLVNEGLDHVGQRYMWAY